LTITKQYSLANTIILIVFAIFFCYFFFSEHTLKCHFVEMYQRPCPTCGMTRDFKKIITERSFENLLNPRSVLYFVLFAVFIASRLLVLILGWLKNSMKPILVIEIFNVLISMVLFCFLG
jgi:hypothetical protein